MRKCKTLILDRYDLISVKGCSCVSIMFPMSCSYALLCFQFEMLTGALPFQGQNRKETMTMILK